MSLSEHQSVCPNSWSVCPNSWSVYPNNSLSVRTSIIFQFFHYIRISSPVLPEGPAKDDKAGQFASNLKEENAHLLIHFIIRSNLTLEIQQRCTQTCHACFYICQVRFNPSEFDILCIFFFSQLRKLLEYSIKIIFQSYIKCIYIRLTII